MSHLAEINEFLEATKGKSATDLFAMMADLDPESTMIDNADLAHAVLGYMQTAFIKGERPSFADAHDRANKLATEHSYLFSTPATAADVVAKPAAVVASATTDTTAPVKVRKADLAQQIFDGLDDKSKANVIKTFVEQLKISPAAAQTYYYNCGGKKANQGVVADGATGVVVGSKRSGPTKSSRAAELYANAPDKSRSVIIARFVAELEMTTAGATTYYYSVSKGNKAVTPAVATATAQPVTTTPADVVAEAVIATTAAAIASTEPDTDPEGEADSKDSIVTSEEV